MSNSDDLFILNNNMEQPENEFPVEKLERIYVNDSNNGSYSNGVIHFDCASISNAGRIADMAHAQLIIPTVLRVSGTGMTDNAMNAFALSWKNKIHTIDSLTVQLSNHTVVEQTEYSSIPAVFKFLTEMTEQEMNLYKYSAGGFLKDNALSFVSEAAANTASAPDNFEFNNRIKSSADGNAIATNNGYEDADISVFSANHSVLERQLDTSYDLTGRPATFVSSLRSSGKPTCERGANSVVYQGFVILELRHLHDFFDKLQLIRNGYLKMSITTNLISKSVITLEDGAQVYSSLTPSLSAKVCPYMITPLEAGVKASALAAGRTLTIESGIGKLADGTSHGTFTVCKLYVPMYSLNVEPERLFLNNAGKTVLYNNYYRAVSPKVLKNAPLPSFILTNGLSRIRSLLIVPTCAEYDQQPMLSPFTSSPSTTSYYALVRNLQVRVGTSVIYQEPVNYSWEMFNNEILRRGHNGNFEPGVCGGLLNEVEWNAAYRYCYVNLNRNKKSQAEDNVSKAITVDLYNSSPYDVVYQFFIEYEKEVKVNQSTGEILFS